MKLTGAGNITTGHIAGILTFSSGGVNIAGVITATSFSGNGQLPIGDGITVGLCISFSDAGYTNTSGNIYHLVMPLKQNVW